MRNWCTVYHFVLTVLLLHTVSNYLVPMWTKLTGTFIMLNAYELFLILKAIQIDKMCEEERKCTPEISLVWSGWRGCRMAESPQ